MTARGLQEGLSCVFYSSLAFDEGLMLHIRHILSYKSFNSLKIPYALPPLSSLSL